MKSSPFLNDYFILIACIMVFSGIACGIINTLFTKEQKWPVWKEVFKYTLLGTLGALMTPLFLHIFSSNLLENLHSAPLNILVFNGFCVFFSLFCIKIFEFITGLQLKVVHVDTKNSKKSEKNNDQPDLKTVLADASVSEESYKIMHAMSGVEQTGKSLSSLFEDSDLPVDKVNEAVSILIAEGHIKQKLNDYGRLRLYLSPHASDFIKKIKKEDLSVK